MSRKALAFIIGFSLLGSPCEIDATDFAIQKSQPLREIDCSCKTIRMRTPLEPWLALRNYRTLIRLAAGTNNIDAELFAALLLNESSGYSFAARYEPGFYRKYIEGVSKEKLRGHWPKWTEENSGELKERLDRSTSFGLGQIMGQTARENGFEGEYLCELCDPEVNIPFAARYLSRKFKAASDMGLQNHELRRGALLRYNGGGDPQYPDRVLAQLENARRIFR